MTDSTPGAGAEVATATDSAHMSDKDVKPDPRKLEQRSQPNHPEPTLPEFNDPLALSFADTILNALKRPRTPEPGESNGSDEKRQKTEEEGAGPANWDIGAMLENALGSFEEQLNDIVPSLPESTRMIPEATTSALGIATSNTVEPPSSLPPPHTGPKPEQKRMKFFQSSTYIVRSMGLPLLGTLAVQVLLALSERSRAETVSSIRSSDSEIGKAYRSLSATFKQARQMFSDSSTILHPDELEIKESGDLETIQMANMATICSTVFETDEEPLMESHDNFLRTFLPEYGPLTDDLTGIFLSLKTQAFLRACPEDVEELKMKEILEHLFPSDLEAPLKQLHPDAPLSQTEKVFVNACKTRRECLASETRDAMKRKLLIIQYPWDGFLDDLNKYLQNNIDTVFRYAESQGIEIPMDEEPVPEIQIDVAPELDLAALQAAVDGALGNANGAAVEESSGAGSSLTESLGLGKLIQDSLEKERPADSTTSAGNGTIGLESKGLASLIAEKLGANLPGSPYHQPTPGAINNGTMQSPYLSHLQQQYPNPPYISAYQQNVTPPSTGGHPVDLPPHQSSPTTVLYERARQAAVAKSTAHARREGLHSTRRPWTPEEERALMTGLDMVKGPHWSQILQLFGSNGTINDILKDRTQVQLKDKARNLKLFFLKTNSEMPYYLQCVTGELKTRAPSQAARKEAEEKARLNSEEEQARVQGIMTLAGGLQSNNSSSNNNNKPASPAPSAPTYSPLTPSGSVQGGRTGSPSTPVSGPVAGARGPIPPATLAPSISIPTATQAPGPVQTNSVAPRATASAPGPGVSAAHTPAPGSAPSLTTQVKTPQPGTGHHPPRLQMQQQPCSQAQACQQQPKPTLQPQQQQPYPQQHPQSRPIPQTQVHSTQQTQHNHQPQSRPQSQPQTQLPPQIPPKPAASQPASQPLTLPHAQQPRTPAQTQIQQQPPVLPQKSNQQQASHQHCHPPVAQPQTPESQTQHHHTSAPRSQVSQAQAAQPQALQRQRQHPSQKPHPSIPQSPAPLPQAPPSQAIPTHAQQVQPSHPYPPPSSTQIPQNQPPQSQGPSEKLGPLPQAIPQTIPTPQNTDVAAAETIDLTASDPGADAMLLQTLKAAISGVSG